MPAGRPPASGLYRFSTGRVSPAGTLLFLGGFPLAQIFVSKVPGEGNTYVAPARKRPLRGRFVRSKARAARVLLTLFVWSTPNRFLNQNAVGLDRSTFSRRWRRSDRRPAWRTEVLILAKMLLTAFGPIPLKTRTGMFRPRAERRYSMPPSSPS